MNNTPSVINKINYTAKIVNAYIAYDFDYRPQNPRGNFVLKNCWFGGINIVKNNDQKNMFKAAMG